MDAANLEHSEVLPLKPRRLQSLDVLRGLTIAGMITVNATAVLEHGARKVFPVLLHTVWTGFTAADAVFPAFITMVGVSVAVSAKSDGSGLPTAKILWRALRLILLGLLLVNMYLLIIPNLPIPPRIPGVLQRIGLVYAMIAFIYPLTDGRTRGLLAGAILLMYWGLCLLPIPDGSPVDLHSQGHSFVCWVDRLVFGSWVAGEGASGFDPEGIMGTFPAFAQALIGTIAGDYLRRGDVENRLRARKLALFGVGGVLLALVWNPFYPICKSLWTSSFVLLSAGITLIGLGLFHGLCDARPAFAKGGPLGSLGRNSIAAYTLHYVLLTTIGARPYQAVLDGLIPIVGPEWAALAPVAMFFVVIWIPLGIMDRKGWYWRI